jgi:hypothetical protein
MRSTGGVNGWGDGCSRYAFATSVPTVTVNDSNDGIAGALHCPPSWAQATGVRGVPAAARDELPTWDRHSAVGPGSPQENRAKVAASGLAFPVVAVGRERLMQERMQARLEELRAELEKGQTELEAVERQRTYLRDTMLRITGAIRVLEELLSGAPSAERNEAAIGGRPRAADPVSGPDVERVANSAPS